MLNQLEPNPITAPRDKPMKQTMWEKKLVGAQEGARVYDNETAEPFDNINGLKTLESIANNNPVKNPLNKHSFEMVDESNPNIFVNLLGVQYMV